MPEQKDIVYIYDGTFLGFLCCVFESFSEKEIPFDIYPIQFHFPSLYQEKYIETDLNKAARVEKWIQCDFSAESKSLLQEAFLSIMEQKEYHLLQFMHLYRINKNKTTSMLQHPSVLALNKALVTIRREASKWIGLLRFIDYSGVLVAIIDPKTFILPLLQQHFCDRYSTERFFIFDETNKVGLLSEYGVGKLIETDSFELPQTTMAEITLQELWKTFVHTIAIKERTNPHLQMNMMPKRYWKHLVELQQTQLKGDNILTLIDNKRDT